MTTLLMMVGATAAAAPARGQPVDGLVLSLEVVDARPKLGQPVWIELALHNVSDHDITLRSYVAAGERHYDWFTASLAWPAARVEWTSPPGQGARFKHGRKICQGRGERPIRFIDSRDRSGTVEQTLRPGERVVHRIDLAGWAARDANPGGMLRGGFYEVSATYQVTDRRGRSGTLWTGTLRTPPVRFQIEGPSGKDMCDRGWTDAAR